MFLFTHSNPNSTAKRRVEFECISELSCTLELSNVQNADMFHVDSFCGMIKICYVFRCSSLNPGSRVGCLLQGRHELHQDGFEEIRLQ